METVYQTGNIVKLEATFFDYDGKTLFQPSNVKLIIYNHKYEVLDTIIDLIVNTELGKYHYEYQTSDNPQIIIYEWQAEKDGKKSIKRSKIRTVFI